MFAATTEPLDRQLGRLASSVSDGIVDAEFSSSSMPYDVRPIGWTHGARIDCDRC
jgi:hypothetical protein